jgi:hypothetical protein
MKEAQITCICQSIRVQDLGLVLYSGQQEWLDAIVAGGSKDLAQAVRAGGVKVRYVERAQVRRPPAASMLHHPPTPPVREEDWLASFQASEKKLPGMIKVQETKSVEKPHVEVVAVIVESSTPTSDASPSSPSPDSTPASRRPPKKARKN